MFFFKKLTWHLRDGPLEKWCKGWGIFSLHEFFFSLTACAGIFFFRWALCTNFFFRQILLFFEQWNLDSLSMFLCFISYSTLTDQRIQATLKQNLFENVHTVREEEATWSGRLPCAFFQSLPSGIPLPQPIIMMPHSIHQNSPSVMPSTPKCQSKKKIPEGPSFCVNFFLYLLLCTNLFLGIFPCMNFFLFPPPPPHHFSNGPTLTTSKKSKDGSLGISEQFGRRDQVRE